jgi:uncharacterized membrane protein
LLEVFIVFGIIVVLAMTLWGYFTFPATIATHYGKSGVPNAYGGKENLLIVPMLSICQAVLLLFLSRLPHRSTSPWSTPPAHALRQSMLVRLLLHWIVCELVWMCCGLQLIVLQSAQGPLSGPILLIPLAIPLCLIVTIILYFFIAARAR